MLPKCLFEFGYEIFLHPGKAVVFATMYLGVGNIETLGGNVFPSLPRDLQSVFDNLIIILCFRKSSARMNLFIVTW